MQFLAMHTVQHFNLNIHAKAETVAAKYIFNIKCAAYNLLCVLHYTIHVHKFLPLVVHTRLLGCCEPIRFN